MAEDRRSGLLQARALGRLRMDGDGARMGAPGPVTFADGLHLTLPGLRLDAGRGSIRPIDGGYYVQLIR